MFKKKLPFSLLYLLIHLPFLSCAFSISLEDPLSSPKFNIIYESSVNDTLDSLTQSYGNGTFLTLGDDMKCFIPTETKMSLLQKINNNITMWNKLLEDSLNEGLDILDSTLHSKCLFQGSGFWKYRFCYGGDLLQYHNSPTDTEFVNKLGSYLGTNNAGEVTLIFDNEIGYYISESLEPGDVCDLTGKKREVKIQYVCGLNKDSPTLQWVREISTCLYEARIMVPGLCSLELLANNEDKLSATQIVCQKSDDQTSKNTSNPYNIEGGIVNIIANFDPTFLNNGIFLLTPVNKIQKLVYLLYTGEMTDGDIMKSALFEKFGTAFNAMIGGKLLKGPNNEIITLHDMIEWWAPVIDSNGQLLFTVNLKMLSEGNAELYLTKKKDQQLPVKTTNFITFNPQDENEKHMKKHHPQSQASVEDNMVVNEAKLDIKVEGNKATLLLKDSKGDIVSVQRVQESDGQFVLLFHILDDNGEPIPLNNVATDELIMDLFENYDMESIIEQLKTSDKVDDNFSYQESGIIFSPPQVEKQSNFHITDSDKSDEDVYLQNIGSAVISKDKIDNHHNAHEGFSSIKRSDSEVVKGGKQTEIDIPGMTLLDEEQVTDIKEEPGINQSEELSSIENDEAISEKIGSPTIESIDTAIKYESIYNSYSADIENILQNSDEYFPINSSSNYQPDYSSTQDGNVDTNRIPNKTSALDSSTIIRTGTVDDISQCNSVSNYNGPVITDQIDSY